LQQLCLPSSSLSTCLSRNYSRINSTPQCTHLATAVHAPSPPRAVVSARPANAEEAVSVQAWEDDISLDDILSGRLVPSSHTDVSPSPSPKVDPSTAAKSAPLSSQDAARRRARSRIVKSLAARTGRKQPNQELTPALHDNGGSEAVSAAGLQQQREHQPQHEQQQSQHEQQRLGGHAQPLSHQQQQQPQQQEAQTEQEAPRLVATSLRRRSRLYQLLEPVPVPIPGSKGIGGAPTLLCTVLTLAGDFLYCYLLLLSVIGTLRGFKKLASNRFTRAPALSYMPVTRQFTLVRGQFCLQADINVQLSEALKKGLCSLAAPSRVRLHFLNHRCWGQHPSQKWHHSWDST
jgi:hypothetical protein